MIRAGMSLIYASLLIKIFNVEKLKPLLFKRKAKCKEKMSMEEAEQALMGIEKAKHFFLSRTACLEQSLATFLLATSNKKSVDWCIG
jgi:hypothetical protein